MRLKHLILLFALIPLALIAQKRKPKPQLLVVGNDIEAFAAAVQSAKSNVPTLWVSETENLAPSLTTENLQIKTSAVVDGGIWMDLLMEIGNSKVKNDSTANIVKKEINSQLAENSINKLLSRIPQLQIIKGRKVLSMKKSSRGWSVTLDDKQKFDFRTIVDASATQDLAKLAGIEERAKNIIQDKAAALDLNESRTVIALGQRDDDLYAPTFVKAISTAVQPNFFDLSLLPEHDGDSNGIPLRMNFAQAIGAMAAYTAFFKTDVTKVDVRKLQTELILFGARLCPYEDISIEDPNFQAIQKIYLSGIFTNPDNLFKKDSVVTKDEIAPVLNQLYSRSQIWFLNNAEEEFTWKHFIELTKFIGLKGDEIERQIKNNWEKKYKFSGKFDENASVTRVGFATVLNQFVDPFTVSVSGSGAIIR